MLNNYLQKLDERDSNHSLKQSDQVLQYFGKRGKIRTKINCFTPKTIL